MQRISAKAVIIRDHQLLVIVKRGPEGEYYILPGGGQHLFETLEDAVKRECLEELGVDVQVGELLFVRDYIARNHEFADQDPDVHQVEIMFACRVPDEYVPRMGSAPDTDQSGAAWLPVRELASARLYPAALKRVLADGGGTMQAYLGDVN